jgi:hypothetical protein
MKNFFTLVAIAFTIACTRETPSRVDSVAASIDTTDTATSAPVDGTKTQPPADPGSWIVTVRGIGPIEAGMTLDEANAAAGNRLVIPPKPEECDWVKIENVTDLLLMVERGTISRVDIQRDSRITTESGAKIGDTEARIKSLYPGVVTKPHAYTNGHYLVVTPSATADQRFRLVFETDGEKVLRYRSGRMPSVEYVEGCS